MKIETALILCAGYGKRVKPLTDITPKPLLKINDLTLLQRCINLIEGLDINHILLNTFYLQDEIKNYIKNNYFKAKISIIEDGDQILDTGGGILNLMNSSSSEDFFIFNPDTLWSKDYLIELEEMESIYFKKKLNNVLMLVDENLSFDKNLKGDFSLHGNLISKNSINNFIYTGCQILNKKSFKNFNVETFSIRNIWNDFIQKNQLYGYESKKKFFHVTNLDVFKKLQDL
ncbi:sugar phosphate nucleotidyltransferase [Candidatus Pelagibacter sp.]|uniref:sugar phosphate nucleotidyltransferase n=1 Tax=Candidatus Pelagibacter sp. TaxID=2024849 RepID=UPI003F82AD20